MRVEIHQREIIFVEGGKNCVHQQTGQVVETRNFVFNFDLSEFFIFNYESFAVNELVDIIALLVGFSVFDLEFFLVGSRLLERELLQDGV